MNKEKLYQWIHEVFVKYDIIWVIKKWFPEDEYQMEEAKIWHYIINKTNCSAEDINNEMIDIMVEWLWNEIVYHSPMTNRYQHQRYY